MARTEYAYEDLAQLACLSYVEIEVPLSAMTNKVIADISLHPEQMWLKVWFDEVLSVEDKTVLDGIVASSLGKKRIKKTREDIMAEILTAASPDPEQLSRLLDALDAYPSMAIALDNRNYALARMRVEKVYVDGAITLTDRDLVLATIPTSEWE